MKALIAITTYNRPDRLNECLSGIIKHTGIKYDLCVVDDHSTAYNAALNKKLAAKLNAHYIFNEENLGIAQSKNKCLAQLADHDFIFLLDDDIYPIKPGWELAFINAYRKTGEHHLGVMFDRFSSGQPNGNKCLRTQNGLDIYAHPCGVLLFFTRQAIERVGGMDLRYQKWGHEHVGLSHRIHNAGFTSQPFLSPVKILDYFYAHDFYQSAESAVSAKEKVVALSKNAQVFQEEKKSSARKPYRPGNWIVSAYLNSQPDPQRNIRFKADTKEVDAWVKSALAKGLNVYLYSDCLTSADFNQPNVFVETVQQPRALNVYLFRWKLYYQFMKHHAPYIQGVFFTDSTDVTVLNNPFTDASYSKETVYLGDEPCVIDIPWMLDQVRMLQQHNPGKGYLLANKSATLLNAGVCGGSYSSILPFAKAMADECSLHQNNRVSDMPIFNYVAYMRFSEQLLHGRKVTTVFKQFDEQNTVSWFRHK